MVVGLGLAAAPGVGGSPSPPKFPVLPEDGGAVEGWKPEDAEKEWRFCSLLEDPRFLEKRSLMLRLNFCQGVCVEGKRTG